MSGSDLFHCRKRTGDRFFKDLRIRFKLADDQVGKLPDVQPDFPLLSVDFKNFRNPAEFVGDVKEIFDLILLVDVMSGRSLMLHAVSVYNPEAVEIFRTQPQILGSGNFKCFIISFAVKRVC